LIDDDHWKAFCDKREAVTLERQRLKDTWVQAGSDAAQQLEGKVRSNLTREYSLFDLLKRPELNYGDIAGLAGNVEVAEAVAEQIEIDAKYSGYISRQQEEIDRLRAHENTRFPDEFDFTAVEGLSNEVKQKLSDARPETLARAQRIPGVTPAAVSLLLVYLKKRGLLKREQAKAS
jgi:tRNA uridine 5-carboxymethylaminomethyl modification enzyme